MDIVENPETRLKAIEPMNESEATVIRGTKRKANNDTLENYPFMDANNNVGNKIASLGKKNDIGMSSTEESKSQQLTDQTCRDIKQRTPEGGWKWVHWIKRKFQLFFGKLDQDKDVIVSDEREYLVASKRGKQNDDSTLNESIDSNDPSCQSCPDTNTQSDKDETFTMKQNQDLTHNDSRSELETTVDSDHEISQLRNNNSRLNNTRAFSDSGFLSKITENSIRENDSSINSRITPRTQNLPSAGAAWFNSTPASLSPKTPFLPKDTLKCIKALSPNSRVPPSFRLPLNASKLLDDNETPSRKRIRVEDDNNNTLSFNSTSIIELERKKGYHLEKYLETKIILEYEAKNLKQMRSSDEIDSDQPSFTDSTTKERQQTSFRSFSQSSLQSKTFQFHPPVAARRSSLFSKEKKNYEEVPVSTVSTLEKGFADPSKSHSPSKTFTAPTALSQPRVERKIDSASKITSFAEWKRKRQDEEATNKYRNAIDQTLAQREQVRKALSNDDIVGLLDAYVPKQISEALQNQADTESLFRKSNHLEEELKKQAVYRENFLQDLNDKYSKRSEIVNEKIQALIRQKDACREEVEKRNEDYHKQMMSIAALAREKYQERVNANLRKEEEEYEKLCPMEEEPEEEEPEEVDLPEITQEMANIIRKALSPPERQLIDAHGITINSKDIVTFTGLRWLNDEVINFYMQMIVQRSKGENWPNVYAMNTFFYPKLRDQGYNSVRRWTKKVDIFAQDLILVPVHLGNHWCLATIDFKKKGIFYYDSMGSPNNECIRALLDYIKAEHMDKKKEEYDVSEFTGENVADIPQQDNMSDCGMFTCKNAEYLSRNAKKLPEQKDMPYFRRRIIYEVVTNTLLHP